ncbi:4418_t:CDS:2 [Ambispora leptoticha]|uniref:4418_t:CDS:1 n=1 Tax=Ambispora leptoticha TaxID=144679 RepID=A0A9N8YXE8_9GLOM|nr:4418_t:CDS:2 [Ambispora leptoticha]
MEATEDVDFDKDVKKQTKENADLGTYLAFLIDCFLTFTRREFLHSEIDKAPSVAKVEMIVYYLNIGCKIYFFWDVEKNDDDDGGKEAPLEKKEESIISGEKKLEWGEKFKNRRQSR